jgi:hypothetical protein
MPATYHVSQILTDTLAGLAGELHLRAVGAAHLITGVRAISLAVTAPCAGYAVCTAGEVVRTARWQC